MSNNKYDAIMEKFKLYHPNMVNDILDWWGSGPLSIFIKFNDGVVIEFDSYNCTIRTVNYSNSSEPSAKEIGKNLQKMIRKSGMTQAEIAERVGISTVILTRYTHGTSIPSVDKAYKLARLLGHTVDELFDGFYME